MYDTLEFNEFLTMIAKQFKHEITLDSLIEAFRWVKLWGGNQRNEFNLHRIFDKTETGVITTEELGRAMSRFGENMKSSELQDMMKEADCAGEGKVDYRSKYYLCLYQFSCLMLP